MTITPNDTFLEFEKHFIGLHERTLHDSFSENDIKIFYTPEGQLSTEQGVYVAEANASKNTKLAKGRFRAYDDQDMSEKRESSGTSKRETGKSTKKTAPVDKAKTAKEEARELLLKEEASVRMKVGQVQKNLSLKLDALGELAIANPIFTHGQLPSLVKYVEPLLSSAIVSDAAFRTMLRLARCTAPPLCNWAPEIAAAIRVISVGDFEMVLDLMPVIMEEDSKKKPSSGIFEQIVNGLTVACKAGPLPADSFTFIFPIMERILLSSKKTCLHDDVLHILSMHLDPILPLPRPRMLSVLYHVLSTVPAYHTSVGPMLNELCLGLRSHELAQALVGVYAKEMHVRLACLNAIKCVPIHSVQQDLLVSGSLWIAAHDPKKVVAELAKELWDRFGFDVITDYSGTFDALYHKNYNVPGASAEDLSAALDENPDKMQTKSERASWTLYDNLVFVKMCIEEKESYGEVSENTYQTNHFIEKFFFKTGKVFTPKQFYHKFRALQKTYNCWKLLEVPKDRRQRNPTKKFKDFTTNNPLYEDLPGLIDLLIQIFENGPNEFESRDVQSDNVSDIVLEHLSTVDTHSNCLDENSIINKLEDRIKSLEVSLKESLKQNEDVEKCRKIEEDKRIKAEKEARHLKKMLVESNVERKNLHKEMMALKGYVSTSVQSILDVYKS